MLTDSTSTIFIILIAIVIVIVRLALEWQRDKDRLNGIIDTPRSYTMLGMLRIIRDNRKAAKQTAKAAKHGQIKPSEDKAEDIASAKRIGIQGFKPKEESPTVEEKTNAK